MKFNYGFEYQNVRYGWHKKQLYRLPFIRLNRTYGLKLIKPVRAGKVYNLQRIQKTIAQLQMMTVPVKWEVLIYKDKDCPF